MDEKLVPIIQSVPGDVLPKEGVAVYDTKDMRAKVTVLEQKMLFQLRNLIKGRPQRLGDRLASDLDPVRADGHLQDRRQA